MARRRVFPNGVPPEEPSNVSVEFIPIDDAAELVTLEDPNDNNFVDVRGAFVRLRPPPDTEPAVISEWRAEVEKVARAVRVVPPQRSALVPLSSDRSDEEVEIGSIREEATALAEESGDADVIAYVKTVLDRVGA